MSIKESFTASNAKTGLQMVPLPMYVAKYITVYNSYESKHNFITTYVHTHRLSMYILKNFINLILYDTKF